MAISEKLESLTARAKDAQARAEAVRDKPRADVEQHVSAARAAAEAQADELRLDADERQGRISDRWVDVRRSWNERVAAARKDIASKKTEHDVHSARKAADQAEDEASFVIDLAYSAVVEAEYAALDAYLARMKAEEMSAVAGEERGPAAPVG